MCLPNKRRHIIVMAGVELQVPASKSLLLVLGVYTEAIVPDVVLRETDVNVKGDVFFGAGE